MTDKNSLGMSTARQVHHNTSSQHQCTHTGQLKHMKDMHTSPLPLIAAVHHSLHKFMYTCTYINIYKDIHFLKFGMLVYLYIYIYIHMYMYIKTYKDVHTHMHTCMHIRTHAHLATTTTQDHDLHNFMIAQSIYSIMLHELEH